MTSLYGSSNPTPVGPKNVIVRTNPNVTKPKGREFRIRDEGKGPHVTDVTYDENLRTLSVRRAGHQTANIDSIRFGKVVNPAVALGPADVTDIARPARWFPDNPGPNGPLAQKDSPTLLPEYAHGDPLPTDILPAGMAYVRLQAGSLPVENSSWDADQESYGVEEEAPKGVVVGVVAASLTDRGSTGDYTKATIHLWYSHRISPRVPGNYTIGGNRLFQITSSKCPVKVTKVTTHATLKNVLVITLNRPVVLTETLRLRVKQASAYAYNTKHPAAESAELNVSYKMARNCYVLVVNRTETNLAVGDKVIIGKPLTVFDEPTSQSVKSIGLSVYDVITTGGATSLPALVSIVGGNTNPTTPNPDADTSNTDAKLDEQGYTYDTAYPDSRPFSFPVPTVLKGKLRTLPRVKDWRKFYIPEDYSFGDKLPRCPDGICFVRLERPYALASSSWASAYDEAEYTPAVGTFPLFVRASTKRREFSTVYIDLDRDCSLVDVRQLIQIQLSPLPGFPTPAAVSVRSYSYDSARKAVKLALSRALDPTRETASVTVPPGVVTYGRGPAYLNPGTVLNIIYSGDKYAICMGLNRNAVQGFGYGDLVLLSQSATTIEDELGLAVQCFEIISPAGPAVPTHTHQNSGGGRTGGGHALFGS
jgi:hypothetical protein